MQPITKREELGTGGRNCESPYFIGIHLFQRRREVHCSKQKRLAAKIPGHATSYEIEFRRFSDFRLPSSAATASICDAIRCYDELGSTQ